MITHGFTVDGEGKKISKSLGNDVDTHKLIATYGAELLRMWTVMVDYREDMRFSDEMMKRVAEAYRKVRNTVRYLLSNLYDFDPAKDAVAEDAARRPGPLRAAPAPPGGGPGARGLRVLRVPPRLPPAGAVRGRRPVRLLPRRAEGPALLRRRRGPRRRSAQTVLHRIARDLCLLLAPVLPFTTDEAWPMIPGLPEPSVHLALFPGREAADEALLGRWGQLLDVRAEVTKALEEARDAKQIAASLEARVTLRGPAAALLPLRAHESADASSPATSPTCSSSARCASWSRTARSR